jgi:hypothetical protein
MDAHVDVNVAVSGSLSKAALVESVTSTTTRYEAPYGILVAISVSLLKGMNYELRGRRLCGREIESSAFGE